ncbi:hypothetical protein C8N30_2904 [Sulfitobacter guttiformis]|uniref:Uncharacterized protein n=1 Tax=Sulfitobacter guttiformis TaxID=74349 RepID=A0A420DHW9_9RHOB|nr:hypothetical protein C8N30_2904 [Sulfitobacter guttiformis]
MPKICIYILSLINVRPQKEQVAGAVCACAIAPQHVTRGQLVMKGAYHGAKALQRCGCART